MAAGRFALVGAAAAVATATALVMGPAKLPTGVKLDRRGALLGLGTAACAPTLAAWADPGTTVTVELANGQKRTFPTNPLPRTFADGLKLPITDITSDVFGYLKEEPYPPEYPLTAADMRRVDESDDGDFYSEPRFVYHIDGGAVAALTHYYKETITTPGLDVLDICSSWVSHYPADFPKRMHSVVGTGMNALELQANEQLSSFVPRDLNKDPTLPFPDGSFDVVTCVVSVDYLINPLKVFREVNRVLRPGGRFILSQSNRLFFTKAVRVWVGLGDLDRLELIGSYFHFAGGFGDPKAFDISAKGRNAKDPMYIVEATKVGNAVAAS